MIDEGKARPEGLTPSQTVGPYFAYALTPTGRYALTDLASNDLATPDAIGRVIAIEGDVRDGDGALVTDALIEIWQPDGEGRFAGHDPAPSNAGFTGSGRCECDAQGMFRFRTVKPGRVAGPNGTLQAPHINVSIFARGLLRHLVTRIYFEDEASNAEDAVLALVPEPFRPTLIARRREGADSYRFDIRLQGENETVFFET